MGEFLMGREKCSLNYLLFFQEIPCDEPNISIELNKIDEWKLK